MTDFNQFVQQKIKKLQQKKRWRELQQTETISATEIIRNQTKMIHFGGNLYLGDFPKTKRELMGAGASRLLAGNHPTYELLENELAKTKQQEASLVVGSGYLANLGAIEALIEPLHIVFADKAIHACMLDGIRLSGAKCYRYRHNNMQHLEKLLQKHRNEAVCAWLLSETIFSMDGDKTPITEWFELAEKYNCFTMLDDAHGLFNTNYPPCHVLVGTLSKALGSYGGYIAADKATINLLKSSARTLLFSTALPEAVILQAYHNLQCLQLEPTRYQQLEANKKMLANALDKKEISHIAPIVIGEADAAREKSAQLAKKGLYVPAICPPTVSEGTARLRVSLTAAHTKHEMELLINVLC
jgi:8-amino-7-oxononanoate synthase